MKLQNLIKRRKTPDPEGKQIRRENRREGKQIEKEYDERRSGGRIPGR